MPFERPSEFWMAPEHLATQHAHSLKDAKELAVHVSKSSHVPRQSAAELGMLLGGELDELRDVLVRAAQILMDHSLQLGHLSDVAERYRLGRERIERVHACAATTIGVCASSPSLSARADGGCERENVRQKSCAVSISDRNPLQENGV